MTRFPLISVMTFLPLVGAFVLFGWRSGAARWARAAALGTSSVVAILALVVWLQFDPGSSAVQLEEKVGWISSLNVFYHVGVDGVSILLLLLTALLVPLSLLASPRAIESPALYYGLVLALQSGLLGAFTTLNFFHWFLFYELSLVPAFFLIRQWGGPERVAAANQFFVYTMVGSVALLLAFAALFVVTGEFGFIDLAAFSGKSSLVEAAGKTFQVSTETASTIVLSIFAGICLGFAVKAPLWPFHTWLPLAYTEAPTGTVMLLTGAMSKLGVYGFLRIVLPIFPDQMRASANVLLVLAVVSIVYSAGAAAAQTDLKRLLSYSSVNHLGYCLLGIFAVAAGTMPGAVGGIAAKASALDGVLVQMFNHGLTAATLFWFVGLLEVRSGGVRRLEDFGGLRRPAPVFCGLMGIAIFSSLGLPGLNGFIGEFLIFKGVFSLATWAAAVSTLGLLITAVFLLKLLQRVFYGPCAWSSFEDLTVRERVALAFPIALMFILGICPQILVALVNSTILELARSLRI